MVFLSTESPSPLDPAPPSDPKFDVDLSTGGNQFIGQYLSVHKDPFSNLQTNRRLEEAVVGDWPKMMKFKALKLGKF
ncbi:hypothetical protein AVEN_175234-1 [Araneus ventricosus]|uniref:Uncharacterized protein n=1 Tax=Araneus ventricosus TaxID=182803 RepID=A0A4Y2NU10_ARAVE|nr:hypothetical protein AVEN_175234-1 [Araneus ventricosus]